MFIICSILKACVFTWWKPWQEIWSLFSTLQIVEILAHSLFVFIIRKTLTNFANIIKICFISRRLNSNIKICSRWYAFTSNWLTLLVLISSCLIACISGRRWCKWRANFIVEIRVLYFDLFASEHQLLQKGCVSMRENFAPSELTVVSCFSCSVRGGGSLKNISKGP